MHGSEEPQQRPARSEQTTFSSWLAKLWPYGRDGRQSSDPAASNTLSRKRGREDDDEGDARQSGRAVRPRQDSASSSTIGGLWQRMSASVAELVDGVRAGYTAAASSEEEGGRTSG